MPAAREMPRALRSQVGQIANGWVVGGPGGGRREQRMEAERQGVLGTGSGKGTALPRPRRSWPAQSRRRPEPGALHSHSPGPEGVRSWAQELGGVSRRVTSPFLGPKLLVDQPATGTRGPATSLTVPPMETAHRAARMNGPGQKSLCNAHAPGGLKRGGHRVWKRSHQGRRRSHGSTCSARGPESSHRVPRTGGLSTQSRAPHHTPPAPPQEGRMEVT